MQGWILNSPEALLRKSIKLFIFLHSTAEIPSAAAQILFQITQRVMQSTADIRSSPNAKVSHRLMYYWQHSSGYDVGPVSANPLHEL
jgi:hypothetical protein